VKSTVRVSCLSAIRICIGHTRQADYVKKPNHRKIGYTYSVQDGGPLVSAAHLRNEFEYIRGPESEEYEPESPWSTLLCDRIQDMSRRPRVRRRLVASRGGMILLPSTVTPNPHGF
jgi:hypothetical protein